MKLYTNALKMFYNMNINKFYNQGTTAWLLHRFNLAYELIFCLAITRMKKYFSDWVSEDNKNVSLCPEHVQ